MTIPNINENEKYDLNKIISAFVFPVIHQEMGSYLPGSITQSKAGPPFTLVPASSADDLLLHGV